MITGAKGGIYGGGVVAAYQPDYDINGNEIAYVGRPSAFELKSGTIAGNVANGYGGGVYLGSNTEFILNGGEILGNFSSSYGGGVSCAVGTNIQLKSGKIAYNIAGRSGGGIYLRGLEYVNKTTLTIEDKMQILYNQANNGGGIGGIVCTVDMKGGIVQGNGAEEGAGFDLYSACMNLSGGKIINNVAQSNGGGILFAATERSWSYSNSSIHFSDSGEHLLRITGGAIENNTALHGNGIYLSRATLESTQDIVDNILNNNKTILNSIGLEIAPQEASKDAALIKIITPNNNKVFFIWLGVGLGIAFLVMVFGLIFYFIKTKNN